eukprot:1568971-Rhodomonas_salina.1
MARRRRVVGTSKEAVEMEEVRPGPGVSCTWDTQSNAPSPCMPARGPTGDCTLSAASLLTRLEPSHTSLDGSNHARGDRSQSSQTQPMHNRCRRDATVATETRGGLGG